MKNPFLLSFRINSTLPPWAGNSEWSQMLVYGIDIIEAERKLKNELLRLYTSIGESCIEIINSTIE